MTRPDYRLKLRPAEGRKVPNPQNDMKPLADAGERVVVDGYFARRLRDGDCIPVGKTEPKASKASKADKADKNTPPKSEKES